MKKIKYINADRLLCEMQLTYNQMQKCTAFTQYRNGFAHAMRMVGNAHSANVVENDTAHWMVYEIANTEEEQPIAWQCGNCDEVVDVKTRYCPECGSRMEGVE